MNLDFICIMTGSLMDRAISDLVPCWSGTLETKGKPKGRIASLAMVIAPSNPAETFAWQRLHSSCEGIYEFSNYLWARGRDSFLVPMERTYVIVTRSIGMLNFIHRA